jgi:hypothetical protein
MLWWWIKMQYLASSRIHQRCYRGVMVEEKGRQTADKKEGRKPWTLREFGGKPVWDWLGLLIVPFMLALITVAFTVFQDIRQNQLEQQRAERELQLAEQRAQDEALQAYLNQMGQLMLDRKLLEAEQGTPLYTLAQARTSTLILRLDAEHNESVTRFLINSRLAVRSEASARLLSGIALSHATLSGAVLSSANLSEANLSHADLSGAYLGDADLSVAYLYKADLSDANLRGADLNRAFGWTEKQLRAANSLEGATMPNGQKYEDWLNSKDREVGGKNDGSS